MTTSFIAIPSINAFEGMIPSGHDLVIYEKGDSPEQGYVLYGFDELEMFQSDFKQPAYGFLGVSS